MAKKQKAAPRRVVKSKTRPKPSSLSEETLFEHLRLKHIRMISSQAHLEIRDGKLPVQAKIASGATVGESPDGTIQVNATMDVEGRPADGSEDSLVKISVLYQCVFELTDGKAKDFAEFGEPLARVGMVLIWPYFRELVHSTTMRMGIPAFVIPMFVPAGKGDNVVSLAKGYKPKP